MEKTSFETKREHFKLSEEEVEQHERAFTLIVRNNLTGEELVNEKTNIVLGCYNAVDKKEKEDKAAIAQLVLIHCNTVTEIFTLGALEKLMDSQKKAVVESVFLKSLGGDNE